MYACIYVCMYVCMYIYIYIYMYVYMYLCMYICIYVCIYVFMYVYMYLCMYICIYVCIYVCVFALIFCLTHRNHKREIPMDSSQYGNHFNFTDFAKNALFKTYGVICSPRAAPAPSTVFFSPQTHERHRYTDHEYCPAI